MLQIADVLAVGGGKLDAGAAATTAVTIEPATLAFGVIGTGTLPVSRTLKITNTSKITGSYGVDIVPSQRDTRATPHPVSADHLARSGPERYADRSAGGPET